MIKTLIRYVLALIVMTAGHMAISQGDFRKGYIIDLKKDSIYGEVAYRNNNLNSKVCRFRLEGVNSKEYSASDILGYGIIGDKQMVSGLAPGLFAEILVKGEVSLYSINGTFILKSEKEMISLGSDKKFEQYGIKPIPNWKGGIRIMTSDCIECLEDLEKLQLQEDLLTDYLRKYNQNVGLIFNEPKSEKPVIKSYVGLETGLLASFVTVFSPQTGTSQDVLYSSSPYVGLIFETLSPRVFDKLSLVLELLYSKSEYHEMLDHSIYKTEFSSSSFENETRLIAQLREHNLMVMALLNYYFGQEDVRFKLFVGSGTPLLSSRKYESWKEESVESWDGYTVTISKSQSEIFTHPLLLRGGLGLEQTLKTGIIGISCSGILSGDDVRFAFGLSYKLK